MIMIRTIKKELPFCGLLILLSLSFFRFSLLRDAVQAALSLCAFSIVPTLFLFLIFTDLFYHLPEGKAFFTVLAKPLARCFRTSEAGASVYLYGILFGFPLGIKILTEYYKEGYIEKEEAEKLLLFSNNTGPAFLIGTVGIGFLKDFRVGLFLYIMQILISFLFGILISFGSPMPEKGSASLYPSISSFSFSKTMQKAIINMLSICGYIIFFSALCSLISPLIPNIFIKGLFFSFFEIGSASSFLIQNFTPPLLHAMLAFAVCFSGISVYMQGADFIAQTDLSKRNYILAKLIQGTLSFFSVLLLSSVFS